MKTKLVYSPRYNFGLMGLEKLHPFDAKKFSRVWNSLESEWRDQLSDYAIDVPQPITDEQLLRVHSSTYLNSLHSNKNIAKVVEIPAIYFLPSFTMSVGGGFDHTFKRVLSTHCSIGQSFVEYWPIKHGFADASESLARALPW